MPSRQRANLSLTGDLTDHAYARLAEEGIEAFLLSTCLRVELVAWGTEETARQALDLVFSPDEELWEGAVVRSGEEAFTHLSRVAAGLESPVKGEREILTQLRQAIAVFRRARPDVKRLASVLEKAVGVGRAVRRIVGASPNGSLGTLAASYAQDFDQVAVLGSGAMARAAVEALPTCRVTVFARQSRAFGGRSALPWGEVTEAFASYPAVISAVPGEITALPRDAVAETLSRRRDPVLVVDLGMPPLPTEVSRHPSVHYVGIDDLAVASQMVPWPEAEEVILSEAGKAWGRMLSDERVSSVISQLMGRAENTVDDEVKRFVHRVAAAEDPEPLLRQLANTVAKRILHDPISYVSSSQSQDQTVEFLAEAFGVEE